eukprot:9472983-Pyramimonas_sp.AAC.1
MSMNGINGPMRRIKDTMNSVAPDGAVWLSASSLVTEKKIRSKNRDRMKTMVRRRHKKRGYCV